MLAELCCQVFRSPHTCNTDSRLLWCGAALMGYFHIQSWPLLGPHLLYTQACQYPNSLIIIHSTCHHLPNLPWHSTWTLDPWSWRWHHHVAIMELGHSWPAPFSHIQKSLQWSPLVLSLLVC